MTEQNKAVEAIRAFLPTNLSLDNPNIGDDVRMPLDCTMGELRALAAALSSPTQAPDAQLKACPHEVRRVTSWLAELASELASQAGVGGMETAGSFVSFLAANPERTEDFIADPIFLKGEPVRYHVEGCLSWHGQNSKIFDPKTIRKMEGRHDH